MATLVTLAGCGSEGGASAWNIKEETDPMTDVKKVTATTVLQGENANLEVLVVCAANGSMAYRLRSFDKDGAPVDIRSSLQGGSLARILQIRVDKEKPYNVWDFAKVFSNQVLITPPDTARLSKAMKMVIRAPLEHGTEIFTVDQGGEDFRTAVQNCVQSLPAKKVAEPATPALVADDTQRATPPAAESKPAASCWTPPSGPNVVENPDGISFQEVQEIEGVTGRPYQQGDSIYGTAESRCPA